MSDDGFDMDPSASDLRIGVEIEYPRAPDFDQKMTSFGMWSGRLRDRVRDEGLPSTIGGRPVHDGTVGLEVLSPDTSPMGGMALGDAPKWYADVIEYIEDEYNEPFAPTGIMNDSTAGLHLHLSPLTRDQAEALYEISTTTWGKAMFCSSVASDEHNDDWRVFRGREYCSFPGSVIDHEGGRNHYACVNYRGSDHYEWRMPEPVDPAHFELIVKFLRLFEQDTEEAIQYAQETLDAGDDRVTAIRRAEAVGMDIEDRPSVRREPAGGTDDFYQEVEDAWGLPEINTVEFGSDSFYLLESRLDGEFEAAGVTFQANDLLYADTLESVEDPALRDEVRRAYNRRGDGEINESEVTDVVKDIVKKKKGKV